MTPTEMLDFVRHKLGEGVPLIGHMQLELAHWEAGKVVVEAPLAPNLNTHGTAFGGSLYCIASMAGWAIVHLTLMNAGFTPSVWIVKGDIAYARPVRGTLRAVATLSEQSQQDLVDQYRTHGKAKISVDIVVQEEGIDCVKLTAIYAAVKQDV